MKEQAGRIFSRKRGPRKALLLSVTRALAKHEKIQTTMAKAKEIAPLFEHLVTMAKSDNLQTRRELLRYLDAPLVRKMLTEIGPRYRSRHGGYTRITKIGARQSDDAKMACIELVK